MDGEAARIDGAARIDSTGVAACGRYSLDGIEARDIGRVKLRPAAHAPHRRPRRRTIVLLSLLALLAAAPTGAMLATGPALAQQSGSDEPAVVQPDTSLPDTVQTPAFAAFWQRFRAAVRANDRGQLQAMTHLPFDFNGKSYGAPDFAALAKQLYDAKTRHCLLGETPLHDQDMYEVFCGETVYVFGTDPDLPDYAATNPDGSAWRLIEIGAND